MCIQYLHHVEETGKVYIYTLVLNYFYHSSTVKIKKAAKHAYRHQTHKELKMRNPMSMLLFERGPEMEITKIKIHKLGYRFSMGF